MFDANAIQVRTFEARAAADPAKREISGVGVPLEVETEIMPGFREVFDQECEFEGLERAKLKTHHRTLIGVITDSNREAGRLNITGRASETRDGDEALALAADGALDSFSIGFRSVEYTRTDNEDGSMTIRHLRVKSKEFSLTDDPAYTDATVTDVREKSNPIEGATVPEPITLADLDSLREEFSEQHRTTQTALALLGDRTPEPVSTRSAGQMLLALASGDADAIREYNAVLERAFAGGTTDNAPAKDGWVGDLTRLFDSSSGLLSQVFATGVLPEKGMNIEFAQLLTNTMTVDEQEEEGDEIAMGEVTLEMKTAKVHTYAGGTELSIQAIKRSTLPLLDRSLEALAIAAGANKKRVLRAAYLALVTARRDIAGEAGMVALGADLTTATANDWTDLIVDAAIKYEALNLPLEALLVTPAVFKHLNSLETDGHRVFKVTNERQSIGALDLPGLRGDIGSVTVAADTGRTGPAAEFVNGRALRQYDSAVTQLQDEDVLNLSKAFSVYRFGAVATEIPAAVVPVKIG